MNLILRHPRRSSVMSYKCLDIRGSLHEPEDLTQRGLGLTSAVSGEVQQQDVGAEVAQVLEGFQMLLQFPVGQFGLQDGRQVSKHVGVQRRRPADSQQSYHKYPEPEQVKANCTQRVSWDPDLCRGGFRSHGGP